MTDTRDKLNDWLSLAGEQIREGFTITDYVVFFQREEAVFKAEPQPCEFKTLDSELVPLDADLCDMPHKAEGVAARLALRMQEKAFVDRLRSAEWNNLGCLAMWQPQPDRKQAIERFKKAKALDKDAQIIQQNLDLLTAVPEPSSTGVIRRPLQVLERDLGKAAVDAIQAGAVDGLRCVINE